MSPESCPHSQVDCLNPYELVRKYRCSVCSAVMMCQCDEVRARRFLPHQLRVGHELDTRREVEVTYGFQPRICRECRGLMPIAEPRSATHGRTSKLRRYYW